MVDILNLYISAAADLDHEREVLSRVVAEIPVTLGWRVTQTPLHGETIDVSALAQAEVHILLLGSDIRAPLGIEWRLAHRANRLQFAFLKQDIARTMAALDFIRYLETQIGWHSFKNIADLRMQTFKLLADHILAQPDYYALKLTEINGLTSWRNKLSSPEAEDLELHGGIGESSVVLSPERYIPSEGVLIKPKPTSSKIRLLTHQKKP